MMDLIIAVPLIVALVSSVKTAGMDSKWAPLLSIALGVIAFYFLAEGDVVARVFEGVVAGLSASGLYSGAKTVVK